MYLLNGFRVFRIRSVSFGFFVATIVFFLNAAHADTLIKTKQVAWGMETWELGVQEFVIEFKEDKPVRVLKIVGNLTAGALPSGNQESSHLVRQSLITLINPGAGWKVSDVELKKTPASRSNHSLAPHLFNINVKQQSDRIVLMPIDYDFRDQQHVLHENKLFMRFENRSYRFDENRKHFESKDPVDALNVEMHLNVVYTTDSP